MNKKMIFAAAAAICLCICLASCSACSLSPGSPEINTESSVSLPEQTESLSEPESGTERSPSAVVDLLIEAVKRLDAEKMSEYMTDASGDLSILGPDFLNGDAGKLAAKGFLENITHKVVSESVNGDGATVKTEFTVPDLAGEMSSIITEIAKKAALQAIMGKKPDVEQLLMEYLADIDFNDMKKITTSADIPLVKRDGAWLVDNNALDGAELMDSITGGLAGKLGEYKDLLK